MLKVPSERTVYYTMIVLYSGVAGTSAISAVFAVLDGSLWLAWINGVAACLWLGLAIVTPLWRRQQARHLADLERLGERISR